MKKVILGSITLFVACCLMAFSPNYGYPCHPNGDIIPCQHWHSGGDIVPCGHTRHDRFGNLFACHPNGDVVPCVHHHPAGDIVPCEHICY